MQKEQQEEGRGAEPGERVAELYAVIREVYLQWLRGGENRKKPGKPHPGYG